MALVLPVSEGRAQTTEWTGAASADWSNPANWTNGLPTPASGTARINTDTPHPTLIDGASVAARGLDVGTNGLGRLEIRNGGTFANTWTSIGAFGASNGSVVVAGPGSRWDASNVVTVAEYGIGTLEILDGAQAHFDGLLVGLDSGGAGARGRGTVTVSGAGSLLTTKWPEIGVFGEFGILNVLDGGRVSVPTDAYVAGPRKGEVNVSGMGSVFQIGGNLETSWDAGGEANVTVSDGGLLDVSGAINLAVDANASASLAIGAPSGAAAAAPGMVEAGGVVFGAGTGRIVFNHTGTDHAFAPAISGAGEIRVEAGRTRISGDQSGFSGVTNVTGGALAVDGVLRGTLGVSGSGRLEGTGTVGATTIAAGATIAPGNSIGTLTIDGDATFEPGSRFEVEVEPGGAASDRIAVTGRAILNGGSVVHVGRIGVYGPRSTYTILTAQGGVEGRFDQTVSDFAFLDPTLGYGANEVSLTLTRNDIAFSQKAVTGNQRASAGALDALTFGNPLHDAVVVLGESEARAAFEELSGEIHASAKAPLIGGSQAVRGVVEQRLRGTLAPSRRARPFASYASLDANEDAAGGRDRGLWARGFGNWGRVRRDAQAQGLRHDEGGVVAGADVDLAEFIVLPGALDALRIGLFGGYSRSTARLEARSSATASRNVHIGVYGGAELGALRLTVGASHALHRVDSVRRLTIPGLEQTLAAAYAAGTTQIFGEAGYRAEFGGFALEPFAGLGYLRFSRDGYTETGGAAALAVTRRSENSAFSTLGLRAFAEFDLAGMSATAHGSIGWRRAYEAGRTSAEVSLAETGPFRVQGALLERDAAIIEAGLDLDLGDRATLSLSYDGRQSARSAEHGLAARIRASF